MAKSESSPTTRSAPHGNAPSFSGNGPVYSVRHRALKAAVWRNETANGPFFNTTVTRSYKDGDAWKESSSFGFDDLLIVAELLRLCWTFVSDELARHHGEANAG